MSFVRVVKRYEVCGLTLYIHNLTSGIRGIQSKSGEASCDSLHGEALTEPKAVPF